MLKFVSSGWLYCFGTLCLIDNIWGLLCSSEEERKIDRVRGRTLFIGAFRVDLPWRKIRDCLSNDLKCQFITRVCVN
jgi:hypothetical protein